MSNHETQISSFAFDPPPTLLRRKEINHPEAVMLDHPLYRAVIEDPDNDDYRLLFADLMDDIGDPRGDFIRTQLCLADSNLTLHERRRLEAVQADLLRQHRSRWNGPLHRHLSMTTDLRVRKRQGRIRPWGYSRGFASHLTVEAATFLQYHTRIGELGPIEHVRFRKLREVQKTLLHSPGISKLKTIAFAVQPFYGPPYEIELFEQITESTQLNRLTQLTMSHVSISPDSARILCGAKLPRLETLDVRHCFLLRDAVDILSERFGNRLLAYPPPRRRVPSYRSGPVGAGTIARWARQLLGD